MAGEIHDADPWPRKDRLKAFLVWTAVLILIPAVLFLQDDPKERLRKALPSDDSPFALVAIDSGPLALGTQLYEPHSTEFIGFVVQTNGAYVFENGEVEPAVLLKDFKGKDRWVYRRNLNKARVYKRKASSSE